MDTLLGEVVRWRMPPKHDTQWHIIEVRDEAGATHAVTGCALPRVGSSVELRGEWQKHERFGPQFYAKQVVHARTPLNGDGVARWLCEHVNGIGDKRARALLAAFSGDAAKLWRAVESGGAELAKAVDAAGLSADFARAVHEAYGEQGADGEYRALLHGWGMTQKQIAKVKAHWALDEAARLLAANPYLLADHIEGFGFNRADAVAMKAGIGHNDPVRVRAALLHWIGGQVERGHVFVDDDLFRVIAREARLPLERLYDTARELRATKRLVIEDGARVYLPEVHAAELRVARDLHARFGRTPPSPDEAASDGETRIVDAPAGEHASDPWQARAVEMLCDERLPIVLLTGGPGTGKTTVLRSALERLRAKRTAVVLAAPTGKAAKRMTEATGQRAFTLHSLLGYRSSVATDCEVCREQQSDFNYSPIGSAAPSMVIVDEASMVDIGLWSALVESAPRARLAFVGDANQLPPVGPGQPFADALATAPSAAVCRLRTVFRGKGEWVKAAAPRVLAGEVPELRDMAGLRWVEVADAAQVVPRALELVQGQLDVPPYFAAAAAQALGQMPILTPQRTGAAGTVALNLAMHDLYNPREVSAEAVELQLDDKTSLRAGSWVMVQRNDARRGICNGDTGTITAIDASDVELVIDGGNGDPLRYPHSVARAVLRLAYASTVHKSQGSEYPWAVVVCHSTHKQMLTRRLVYTAITRAKEGVVLLGDRGGVEWAISNAREVSRCTWLQQRVRAAAATVSEVQHGGE